VNSSPSAPSRDLSARVVVWTAWLALTVTFAVFFLRDRSSVPMAEDWYNVAVFTGHRDIPEWLWEQNNEHRSPVPRLFSLGVLKLAHGRHSVLGAVNLVLLALTAAGLIAFARRARGGESRLTDTFFPLVLLNWGHSCHVLHSYLVALIMPVMGVLVIGCALVRPRNLADPRVALAAALSLVVLPLCGLTGLLYVPTFGAALAFVAWLLGTGKYDWPVQRTASAILGVGVTLAVIASALYFVGYEPPPWSRPSPGTWLALRSAGRVLSLGFGVAAEWHWTPFILATAAFLGLTVLTLALRVWRARGEARETALGLAIFASTAIVFGFGIGWSRAGWEAEFGIPSRYALLVAPAFIAGYLAWDRLELRTSRGVVTLLAFALLALLPFNTRAGDVWFANWYRAGMQKFQWDLDHGIPIDSLAQKHQPFLVHWWESGELAENMRWLKQHRVRPFDKAKDTP